VTLCSLDLLTPLLNKHKVLPCQPDGDRKLPLALRKKRRGQPWILLLTCCTVVCVRAYGELLCIYFCITRETSFDVREGGNAVAVGGNEGSECNLGLL
jgi:hypothetical protein